MGCGAVGGKLVSGGCVFVVVGGVGGGERASLHKEARGVAPPVNNVVAAIAVADKAIVVVIVINVVMKVSEVIIYGEIVLAQVVVILTSDIAYIGAPTNASGAAGHSM